MTLAKRVLGLLMLACATGAHVRLDMARRRAGLSPRGTSGSAAVPHFSVCPLSAPY